MLCVLQQDVAMLKMLHWLPIKYRIKYKIALLTYKCLHGEGPGYLISLLEDYKAPRKLRSSEAKLLVKPNIKTEIGRRVLAMLHLKSGQLIPENSKIQHRLIFSSQS